MPPSSQMIANLKWGVVAFQVKVSTNLGDIAKGIQLSPTKGPVSISLAQLFGGGAADSRLSKVQCTIYFYFYTRGFEVLFSEY